jgi:hypothetical protein
VFNLMLEGECNNDSGEEKSNIIVTIMILLKVTIVFIMLYLPYSAGYAINQIT